MSMTTRITRFRQAAHRLSRQAAALLAIAVLLLPSALAYAADSNNEPPITPELRQQYADEGIYYIDNQCGDVLSGNPNGTNTGSDSGTWNSGLTPPYILE